MAYGKGFQTPSPYHPPPPAATRAIERAIEREIDPMVDTLYGLMPETVIVEGSAK